MAQKKHPEAMDSAQELMGQHDIEQRTIDLVSAVRSDEQAQTEWMDRQLRWTRRRLSDVERRILTPWVGASARYLPLSDVYCTQLTPAYYNSLFGGPQTISMEPRERAAFETAELASKVYNSMLRPGGPHAMPDLKQQMRLNISDTLTTGRGRLKVDYAYETRLVQKVLRKNDMPGLLGKIGVVHGMSRKQRQEILVTGIMRNAKTGQEISIQMLNPPDVMAVFGEPINPMRVEDFSRYEATIRKLAIDAYGLDTEDKVDSKALDGIIDFMKTGVDTTSAVIKMRAVIHDGPRITSLGMNELIVPVGTRTLQRAERLAERLFFTEQELLQYAEDHDWNKDGLTAAMEGGEVRGPMPNDVFAQQTEDRLGVFRGGQDTAMFEIWRVYGWEDYDGDGLMEPIVTTVEPNNNEVLKKIELPYDHGEFPFVATHFEAISPLYHDNRGIVEILADVEEHVTEWHRQLENNMTLGASVMFKYRKQSFHGFEELQLQPGVGIPVEEMDDIEQFNVAPHDIPIERMNGIMMLWPERLLGGVDDQLPQDEHFDRPRTATQTTIMDRGRRRVVSYRVEIWLDGVAKALQQGWQLWRQWGPDDFYSRITGREAQRMTQYQIRGAMDVVPVAAVGNMDPGAQVQTAMSMFQLALQSQSMMDQSVQYVQDPVPIYIHAMRTLDPVLAERMISERPPEQQQAMLQQQQEAAAKAAQIEQAVAREIQNDGITPEEQVMIADEVTKDSAYGKRQKIVEESRAAQGIANRNAALAAQRQS